MSKDMKVEMAWLKDADIVVPVMGDFRPDIL